MATRPYGKGPYGTGPYARYRTFELSGIAFLAFDARAAMALSWAGWAPCEAGGWQTPAGCEEGAWAAPGGCSEGVWTNKRLTAV